ncbi:hypothetical protein ABKN59_010118 [Abortiporus biennis]
MEFYHRKFKPMYSHRRESHSSISVIVMALWFAVTIQPLGGSMSTPTPALLSHYDHSLSRCMLITFTVAVLLNRGCNIVQLSKS